MFGAMIYVYVFFSCEEDIRKTQAAEFPKSVSMVRTGGRAIAQAVSHRGGPGSTPGLVMWDLWWTKWRWGRFSPSTSVSPANLYSTNCSTITLIYHLGLVQ
jgi:hypothetical protein